MINDPMSQMAQAQKLSIPQLQQALRDGTINPQVGQIVLASKIKQDKDAKAAMAAQAPKQPPVAQQNMSYGAAPGIDTMPTNLPVAGMAGGGIIAFDEGGHVPRYGGETDGSQVVDPIALQRQLDALESFRSTNNTQTRAGNIYGNKTYNPREPGYQYAQMYPSLNSLDAKINDIKTKLQSSKTNTPVNLTAPQSNTNYTDNLLNMNAMAVQAAPSGNNKYSESDYNLGGNKSSGAISTKGTPGIGGFDINKGFNITPYTDAKAELQAQVDAELNPKTGKPWTYAEKAEERKANQIAAGVDFDLFGKQKQELEGKKDLSESRSRLNEAMPWFAAAERLAQAPKPGESTMTAFTSAAANAGKTKAEIADKEDARQEKITDKLNNLALAQNNFNAAQYSGNDADLKEADRQMKAARANLTSLGIKGIDQQNKAAEEIYKAKVELTKTAMQEAGANARYGREDQMIARVAQQIHLAHPELAPDEVSKQAYQTVKFQGSMYGADVGAEKNKLTQYNKYASDFTKSMANYGKQPLSYEQWLAGAGGSMAAIPNDITAIMGQYSQ